MGIPTSPSRIPTSPTSPVTDVTAAEEGRLQGVLCRSPLSRSVQDARASGKARNLAVENATGETVQLTQQAVSGGRRPYVLVNNSSEGNAPLTVQALCEMLRG